ncbi:MAG: O-antigen ligase family protein [Mariprofundus sp.]
MLNDKIHTVLFAAYAGLFFWLPIPLGSKYPWSISVMEIWVYLLTIAIVWLLASKRLPIPDTLKNNKTPLLLISAATLWIGFQCLPLPASLLSFFSPAAALIHSTVTNPGASISLDASITSLQLQKSLALTLLFALTLILVHSRQRLQWLAYVIIASAFIQALAAITLELSGIQYNIDQYTYSSNAIIHSGGRATGFYSNPDHLAGWLEMALAIGVGLLISMLHRMHFSNWQQRIRHYAQTLLGPKARLRIILIILCIALVMTHSRMGNSAFFISLMVSGILFLILSRHASKSVSIFIISLIILDIVIIGSWFGFQKVVQRVEQTTMEAEASRGDVYVDSYAMIDSFKLSGIGAGNYFSAFPGYKQDGPNYYIDHVHNDYLELVLELGLLGTIPLALLVLLSLAYAIRALKQRRSGLILGMNFAAIMGTTSILIHSSVDFNLQVPANAALFTTLIAIPFICHQLKHQPRHHTT